MIKFFETENVVLTKIELRKISAYTHIRMGVELEFNALKYFTLSDWLQRCDVVTAE